MLMFAPLRPASCLTSTILIRQQSVVTHVNNVMSLLPLHHRLQHDASRSAMMLSARTTTRLYSTSNNSSHDKDNDGELWYHPSLMDHMLYRIKEVNNVPYNIQHSLINFTINGRLLGKVTPKVAERLTSTSPIFELSTGCSNQPTLTLSNAAGTTIEQRTRSVALVMEKLRDAGYLTGWRDELYPVAERFDSPPVFLIERAAASLLGVLEYGVHINGLVDAAAVVDEENDNEPPSTRRMWMARRSKTKSKYPGFMDHIVAGGQPAGLSLMDNVMKECMEEAGIPPEITKRGIQPAGAVSYENYEGPLMHCGEGVMSRVVLFCFDLVLPSDFVPVANDGEVESFVTWSLEDVGRAMDPEYDDPIKPNCYPGK